MLSGVLVVLALGWYFGVEVYRGLSQDLSSRMFWLHLTAPVVLIALMLVAMWLTVNTDRLRRHRGLSANQEIIADPSRTLLLTSRSALGGSDC